MAQKLLLLLTTTQFTFTFLLAMQFFPLDWTSHELFQTNIRYSAEAVWRAEKDRENIQQAIKNTKILYNQMHLL